MTVCETKGIESGYVWERLGDYLCGGSVLQFDAVCCRVMWCVVACCRVLQGVEGET